MMPLMAAHGVLASAIWKVLQANKSPTGERIQAAKAGRGDKRKERAKAGNVRFGPTIAMFAVYSWQTNQRRIELMEQRRAADRESAALAVGGPPRREQLTLDWSHHCNG